MPISHVLYSHMCISIEVDAKLSEVLTTKITGGKGKEPKMKIGKSWIFFNWELAECFP